MHAAETFAPIVTREAAPLVPLVTTADAKAVLRISHDDEDDVIAALAAAAAAHLDGFEGLLRRALVTQKWRVSVLDADSYGSLFAPLSPVQAVELIQYYPPDVDTLATESLGNYRLIKAPDWAYIEPKAGFSWPSTDDRPDALQAVFRIGYGDTPADVPASIVHAAKLIIGHLYENREETTALRLAQLPLGVSALIYPHTLGFAA